MNTEGKKQDPETPPEVPENTETTLEGDIKQDDDITSFLDNQDSDFPPLEAPEDLPPPSIKKLLFSPDSPSRLMTFLSLFFALLASICMILLISTYLNYRKELAKHKLHPLSAPVIEKTFSESLGEFKLVLKPEKESNDGELRVTIVVECPSLSACEKIKEHLAEARDLANPVLSSASREDLLTLETKNRIKRTIKERLNTLTEPEKLMEINFSDLTIENTH